MKLCGRSNIKITCYLGKGYVAYTIDFSARLRLLGPDVHKDSLLKSGVFAVCVCFWQSHLFGLLPCFLFLSVKPFIKLCGRSNMEIPAIWVMDMLHKL